MPKAMRSPSEQAVQSTNPIQLTMSEESIPLTTLLKELKTHPCNSANYIAGFIDRAQAKGVSAHRDSIKPVIKITI